MPAEETAVVDPAPSSTETRGKEIIDKLFSDNPAPVETPAEPPVKKAPAKKAAKVSETPDDDEPEDVPAEPTPEEQETNFDDPITDEDPDAEDPPDQTPEERETVARKMAKENGKKAKLLTAQNKELELEIERVRNEAAEERRKREEIEALKVDPLSHPEIKQIQAEVMKDVRRGAQSLGIRDPKLFVNNFGVFLEEFVRVDDLDGDEYDSAFAALRSKVIDETGEFDVPYDELDDLDQAKANKIASRAMDILGRNVSGFKKAQALAESLNDKAKVGRLAVGVREYEAMVARYQPALDTVGDLADDVIESDPHSISSVVARGMKESPAFRKRVEDTNRKLLSLFAGPRALTQAEMDKLVANGTDLKSFESQRQKAHQEEIVRLLPQLCQGLVCRPLFKDNLSALSELRGKTDDEDAEFEISRRATNPDKPKIAPPKDKDKIPASQRKNAEMVKMFGPDYDK